MAEFNEEHRQKMERGRGEIPPPAVYVNAMRVGHTADEFLFEFGQRLENLPAVRMLYRIVTAPSHAKKMLRALQENVDRYERRYGVIEVTSQEGEG